MDGTVSCLVDSADPLPVPILSESAAGDDYQSTDIPHTSQLAVFGQCYELLLRLLFLALDTLWQARREITELRCQAHYWEAQHRRAVQREAELKDEKQHLHAEIRELKQRLFGRKAETSSAADPKSPAAISGKQSDGQRRRRGHQPGTKGHGRRNHDHLPTKDEPCILPEDQRCCPYCQEPFEEIPGTADGDILEIEVRAYRRRYHRQRYRRH